MEKMVSLATVNNNIQFSEMREIEITVINNTTYFQDFRLSRDILGIRRLGEKTLLDRIKENVYLYPEANIDVDGREKIEITVERELSKDMWRRIYYQVGEEILEECLDHPNSRLLKTNLENEIDSEHYDRIKGWAGYRIVRDYLSMKVVYNMENATITITDTILQSGGEVREQVLVGQNTIEIDPPDDLDLEEQEAVYNSVEDTEETEVETRPTHTIRVTWNFNEDQEDLARNQWTWDDDATYRHFTWVTFTIPDTILPEIFGELDAGGANNFRYNIPLEGLTPGGVDNMTFEENADTTVEPVDSSTDNKEFNVYFTYKVEKPLGRDQSRQPGARYDSTEWKQMMTVMKHHNAKCITRFCKTYLEDLDEDYPWKLTEESEERLIDQPVWKEWFDSGDQPKSFTVEIIPEDDTSTVYSDSDDEDTPIPQFYDRLIPGFEDGAAILALGQDISYLDFLRLGSFNIPEKLIYDDYTANVKDVGCTGDGKSNLEYPVRTGPAQSQIYCMADLMKWISTGEYNYDNGRNDLPPDPINKLDPGTNAPLRNMTIHIMDRKDIEDQEWKDIQIARQSLSAQRKKLSTLDRDKIKLKRTNLNKNKKIPDKMRKLLNERFTEEEEQIETDIKEIDRKLARLPTTKRLLSLAKIERNKVERIFGKLKF